MSDNPSQIPVEPEKPPRWFRILVNRYTFILFCIICLAVAPFAYRGYVLSQVPYIDEPFDLEEFGTVEVPDNENAHLDYKEATILFVDRQRHGFSEDDEAKLAELLDGGTWDLATPAIVDWLEKNQSALKRWKVGAQKSDYLFTQPKDLSFSTDLDCVDDLRVCARLGILQGKKLEAEGESDKALEYYLDVLRVSRHTGRHGCMIERLVGAVFHLWSSTAILKWSHSKKVNSALIRKAKKEIERIYLSTEIPSTNLKCEYLTVSMTLRNPREEDTRYFMENESQLAIYGYYFLFAEPDFSLEVYKHIMKNWLDNIDLPKNKRDPFFAHPDFSDLLFDGITASMKTSNRLSNPEITEYLARAIYLRSILPAITRFLSIIDVERTRQGILQLVLSIEEYRRENKKYPPDLQALVDEAYIKSIPLDSSQSNKCYINYRSDKDCVSVYGLHRDGIDNGGSSAGFENNDPDFGYIIESREKKVITPNRN